MKRTNAVVFIFLLLIALGTAVAYGDSQGDGPDTIKLKMGDKDLVFSHRKHQQSQNSECFHCHKEKGHKIEGWGKDTAHQLCIPCHDLNEKGPVECKECHNK